MRVYVLSVVAVCLLLGCADVSIQKIPNRSDYATWTDADQRRVDGMCGLRFYRSRPYVAVKKPFVVASKTYLVDAVTSHDGKFVRIVGKWPDRTNQAAGNASARQWKPTIPQHLAIEMSRAGLPKTIPYSSVVKTPVRGRRAPVRRPSGGAAEGDDAGTISAGELDTIEPHETAGDSPSGTATLRLQTRINAFAHKELTTYYDLIYLPDLEEQYVISPNARLGGADLSLTRGPGGELMAMGMRVDNSAITRPLVDAYSSLVKGGSAAAQKALGWSAPAGEAEGEDDDKTKARTAPDKVITVRMHVVKMATPGLYPILKASEMLEDRHRTREIGVGFAVGAGACNPYTQAAPYNGRCGDLCETHVVPVYPYSRIAYQVHTTVVVEHLLTEETVRSLPGFAEGTKGAGGAKEPAKAATHPDLQDLVDSAASGAECVEARVQGWGPADAAVNKITTLRIKLKFEDGAIPSVKKACKDHIKRGLASMGVFRQDLDVQFEE